MSMTMNGAVLPVLAMYIAAAEEQVTMQLHQLTVEQTCTALGILQHRTLGLSSFTWTQQGLVNIRD